MSNRRIRLVHVIMNLNYGGMERLLNDLIRHLPPAEFEIHLVLLDYVGRFGHGLDEFATLHTPGPMSPFSLLRPLTLERAFRQIRPDIVHSHSGVWLKGARAARAAGVPRMVHTEHGRAVPDPLINRLVDRMASRSTDVVVAVSEPLAALLRQRVVSARTRIDVIINGVDPSRFTPASTRAKVRARIGLGPKDVVIGSIGRLEPVKNYALALRAFARLPTELSDPSRRPVLVVAGDGSERASLERSAERLGIRDSVRFLGWRDDIEELLPGFDLYTMCSDSEGTSISLLEAMSAGLAAVVTEVGGNPAVLGPELRDQLVAAGDEPALARAWARFIENPDLRRERGERSRARVMSHFSVTRTAEEYADLYRELSGKAGS